jgi:hypothetical protein
MTLTFDDTQAAALLEALGLPADSTDVDLVVQTAQDLAAQVEALDPAKPASVAAAAARNGCEVLDKDTADALRRDAQAGRQIAAAAAKARIETAVDKAVDRGAITVARKRHWIALLEADPAMEQVLAAVPDELAVSLSEVGHSADNTGDLAEASPWFYS